MTDVQYILWQAWIAADKAMVDACHLPPSSTRAAIKESAFDAEEKAFDACLAAGVPGFTAR